VPGIVSLLPSATEWVYALGLQDDLRGVTFECDEPAAARTDHRVVVTGLASEGMTPGEIDARVKERVRAGLGLYDLDAAAMAEIGPDLVLTQDLCRVCALPAGEAEAALDAAGCPGEVVTLDPHRLDEVLDGAVAVASAAGRRDEGERLRAGLRARLDAVAAAVAGRRRPRVLVLEWTDPAYLAGHWVPDLVVAAGGDPVLALPGERSVGVAWADVTAAEADVVLVTPCGYGLDDALEQGRGVRDRLPSARVWAVDAGALVTRPGPRVVDGIEALAWALHGDVVPAPPAGRVARVPS
jgi:iron complex transport system substrate-binding protein